MGKKNKFQQASPSLKPKTTSAAEAPLISQRGKIAIALGIATGIFGFFLVTFTDPAGQNWASRLCPFVILGGYALIGVGILLPDPQPTPAGATPSLPPSQKSQ